MYKGIDLVWAVQFVLNEERRQANEERNALLRSVVAKNFELNPIEDAAQIAKGALVLQRLRTFSESEMPETMERLCVAFPALDKLFRQNPKDAQGIVLKVVGEIKEASKKTFGLRTGTSVNIAVLKTAEPSYFEENLLQFVEADIPMLQESAQRVRDFIVDNEEDFRRWLDLALANFLAFEDAEERARIHKPHFPGMGTAIRTYHRNWDALSKNPELFRNCWNALKSGQAQEYAQERAMMEQRRRDRQGALVRTSPSMNRRRSAAVWDHADSGNVAKTSLKVKVETTTLPTPLTAVKDWNAIPSESLVVRDWMEAILGIWGSIATSGGVKVNCAIQGRSGASEIEFIALDADEARTKVMQFVRASN